MAELLTRRVTPIGDAFVDPAEVVGVWHDPHRCGASSAVVNIALRGGAVVRATVKKYRGMTPARFTVERLTDELMNHERRKSAAGKSGD